MRSNQFPILYPFISYQDWLGTNTKWLHTLDFLLVKHFLLWLRVFRPRYLFIKAPCKSIRPAKGKPSRAFNKWEWKLLSPRLMMVSCQLFFLARGAALISCQWLMNLLSSPCYKILTQFSQKTNNIELSITMPKKINKARWNY